MSSVKYYNYGAKAAGYSFANGDTTNAVLVGATQAILSNGALLISSDTPTGIAGGSLTGTTQGVSGTSYLTETITSTGTLSVTIYWKMPATPTIGDGMFYGTNSGTRQFSLTLLNTNQIKFFSASNGNIFTSTFSGGFVANQWYRTDFYVIQGASTTTGTLVTATYLEHGTSSLTGTTFTASNIDVGTLGINQFRHGPRATTGTADDNFRIRVGYDRTAGYLIGPPPTAAVAMGFGITATGSVSSGGDFTGTAAVAPAIAITAGGIVGEVTSATIAPAIAITAGGVVGDVATAAVSPAIAITATGAVGEVTTAAVGVGIGIVATGVVGKVATGAISLGTTLTAAGATVAGLTTSAAISPAIAITAGGVVGRSASAPVAVGISIVATGVVGTAKTAPLSVGIAITATGVVARASSAGIGSSIDLTAAGVVGALAAGAVAAGIDIDADGFVAMAVDVDLDLGISITAVGVVATVVTPDAPLDRVLVATVQNRTVAASVVDQFQATTAERTLTVETT